MAVGVVGIGWLGWRWLAWLAWLAEKTAATSCQPRKILHFQFSILNSQFRCWQRLGLSSSEPNLRTTNYALCIMNYELSLGTDPLEAAANPI